MSNIVTPFTPTEAVSMQQFNARVEEINQGAASADSVAKIIDGTTTVGNAAKLGGVAAGNFARNLGAATGTDLLAWVNQQTTGGVFSVASTVTTNVPSVGFWVGNLEYTASSNKKITLTSNTSGVTYTNITSSGNWTGWKRSSDGGNASQLGGVAAGNYPRALTVTGTDLLTWAAAQAASGYFSVNNTVTSGVPATSYWSGLLETFSGSTCRIILTRRVSPYDTYVNIGSGGSWNGWKAMGPYVQPTAPSSPMTGDLWAY